MQEKVYHPFVKCSYCGELVHLLLREWHLSKEHDICLDGIEQAEDCFIKIALGDPLFDSDVAPVVYHKKTYTMDGRVTTYSGA